MPGLSPQGGLYATGHPDAGQQTHVSAYAIGAATATHAGEFIYERHFGPKAPRPPHPESVGVFPSSPPHDVVQKPKTEFPSIREPQQLEPETHP